MFPNLSNSAKAFLFYVLAFGLTLTVSLLSPLLGELTMLLHMFTPTLAALLMLLVVTRDGRSKDGWRALGLHRAGLRWWGFALLGPLAVMLAVYGLVWLIGVGRPMWPAGFTLADLPLEFIAQLVITIGVCAGRGDRVPRLPAAAADAPGHNAGHAADRAAPRSLALPADAADADLPDPGQLADRRADHPDDADRRRGILRLAPARQRERLADHAGPRRHQHLLQLGSRCVPLPCRRWPSNISQARRACSR